MGRPLAGQDGILGGMIYHAVLKALKIPVLAPYPARKQAQPDEAPSPRAANWLQPG